MSQSDDKFERLNNLLLTLLGARPPLPLSRIRTEVPGYPSEPDAARQAFYRDKDLLLKEGVEIKTVEIDGPDQAGYWIDPETYFLPDLGLEDDEQAALNLAISAVHLEDVTVDDALRKLDLDELSDVQVVATMATDPGVDRLCQACKSHSRVTFMYLGEQRTVHPARVRFNQGHWYLTGWSEEREAGRNYRVDRIEGEISVGSPGTGAIDPSWSIPLDSAEEPWRADEVDGPVVEIELVVDPPHAWRVERGLGAASVLSEKDGSIVVKVGVAREELARSWVLSMLEHAEVLSPASFRTSMVEWLKAIVDQPQPKRPAPELVEIVGSEAPEGRERKTPAMQARVRRGLAMLEWIAAEGSAPTSEIAERFGMSVDEVVAELELAACCGRAPFQPEDLLEIIVDSDEVIARLPELARPRQLTAAQGVAIAAAAKVILALPGAVPDGPLSRAVAKLEGALGLRGAVEVDVDAPPLLEELRRAAEGRRELEVRYLSISTGESSTRVIDPFDVLLAEGRWYVDAWCHKAGARRTFRADCFEAIKDLGAQPDSLERPAAAFELLRPSADADVVILSVGPGARWLTDSVPVLGTKAEDDGTTTVALSVSRRGWLEKILLQAGSDAAVLGPEHLRDVGREAAERILRRY